MGISLVRVCVSISPKDRFELATQVDQSSPEIGVPSARPGAYRLGAQHPRGRLPSLLDHISKSAGGLIRKGRETECFRRILRPGPRMTLLLLFAVLFLLPPRSPQHSTLRVIGSWIGGTRTGPAQDFFRQPSHKRRLSCVFSRRGRCDGAALSQPTAGLFSRMRAPPATVDLTIRHGANRSGWTGLFPMVVGLDARRKLVFAADGAKAERMIPLIREAIRELRLPQHRRLSGLARTELEHLRRCDYRRGAGNAGGTSPHRGR